MHLYVYSGPGVSILWRNFIMVFNIQLTRPFSLNLLEYDKIQNPDDYNGILIFVQIIFTNNHNIKLYIDFMMYDISDEST